MILEVFEETMTKLTVEQLEEWAQFKEDLLKDKRLILALPKTEAQTINNEMDAIFFEIWRRKFQPVIDQLQERFGNHESNGNE